MGEDYEFSVGLVLQNFAAEESTFGLGILKTGEPQAKNIRIRVVDDGGLEIDRPRLEHGTELDPGERDTAELEITVPEELAQDVVQGGGGDFEIVLELRYDAGENDTITKTYPFEVKLVHEQDS